jgi:hypothetical protein
MIMSRWKHRFSSDHRRQTLGVVSSCGDVRVEKLMHLISGAGTSQWRLISLGVDTRSSILVKGRDIPLHHNCVLIHLAYCTVSNRCEATALLRLVLRLRLRPSICPYLYRQRERSKQNLSITVRKFPFMLSFPLQPFRTTNLATPLTQLFCRCCGY